MEDIIVTISGGLGNQMSQYAMIRLLNYLYPEKAVAGDISLYKKYSMHNGFELPVIFQNIKLKTMNRIDSIVESIFYARKRISIEQVYTSGYPEDKIIFNLRKEKLYKLNGTWHNYDYTRIRNLLMEEFVFSDILDKRNKEIINMINQSMSVSIHVRRGDYKKLGLDIIGIEYYKKAIDFLNSKLQNPVYFIFSDERVRDMFTEILGKFIFVEENIAGGGYIDMQLMSCCKHNIIANSTFSYWAAYLNSNPNKIIIRPKMQTKTNRTWMVPGWILL